MTLSESVWYKEEGMGRKRVNFRDICIMTGLGDHIYESKRQEDNKSDFEVLAGEVG